MTVSSPPQCHTLAWLAAFTNFSISDAEFTDTLFATLANPDYICDITFRNGAPDTMRFLADVTAPGFFPRGPTHTDRIKLLQMAALGGPALQLSLLRRMYSGVWCPQSGAHAAHVEAHRAQDGGEHMVQPVQHLPRETALFIDDLFAVASPLVLQRLRHDVGPALHAQAQHMTAAASSASAADSIPAHLATFAFDMPLAAAPALVPHTMAFFQSLLHPAEPAGAVVLIVVDDEDDE